MVALGTRIPMLLQALKGLGENCAGARTRLERDYQSITARYSTIFGDLEHGLTTSLRKLDKPAYELAENARRVILEPLLGTISAGTLLAGQEGNETVGAFEVSHLKELTATVVSRAARNVNYNVALTDQIDAALRGVHVPPGGRICMPVIVMVADAPDTSEKQSNAFSGAFSPSQMDGVAQVLTTGENRPLCAFDRDENERNDVESFFRKRLSSFMESIPDTDKQKRLSGEIMRMWGLACAPSKRKQTSRSVKHG